MSSTQVCGSRKKRYSTWHTILHQLVLLESEASKYLSLIGGLWAKEDGGDPDTELLPLIKTAMCVSEQDVWSIYDFLFSRTTKDFLGINLEHVLKWTILGKIHFTRLQEERHGKTIPRHEDITVILFPYLSHVCIIT